VSEICTQVAERCVCIRGVDHEGPHVCSCGGAWLGRFDEASFRVLVFPTLSVTVADGDAYAASLIEQQP
jgi:hypothetical protein